jgi:hypothetical protein
MITGNALQFELCSLREESSSWGSDSSAVATDWNTRSAPFRRAAKRGMRASSAAGSRGRRSCVRTVTVSLSVSLPSTHLGDKTRLNYSELGLASAVILGSESCRTHGHSLPSHSTTWWEREREERRLWGEGVVRGNYNSGRSRKVPRQCPLVLLVGVKLVFRINSKF